MRILEETTVILLHLSDILFAVFGTCIEEFIAFDLMLSVYGQNESN